MTTKKASAAQEFTAGVDIKNFRDAPEAELAKWRENQKKRNRNPELIDQIVAEDVKYRAALKRKADLAKQRGALMQSLNPKKGGQKTEEEKEAIKAKSLELKKQVEEAEKETEVLFKSVEKMLSEVGVMIQPDVPVSLDEADNVTVCTCGKIPNIPNFKAHHELLSMIDGYDAARGARVAGHRGYYLKGSALRLNQALFRYGIDFLTSRGFTSIHTPFFMRRDIMGRVCQLEDFQETLYHVDSATNDPNDDMFLIATSEQTLCGFHLGESLDATELPKKYAGFSTCFRKEAGASGKDNWGIFRVHQFEKVEQFCITSPHDGESDKVHHEMINNACEFLRTLGIPFRVVCVVSGELNYSTSKKYDIEGWFPSYGTYRELVSGSNCLDFQSRKLGIRFGHGKTKGGEKEYVHMLNCTLCATERTLCAILENYQTPEGIKVPKVLQPYLKQIIEEEQPRTDYNMPDVDLQAEAENIKSHTEDLTFIPFVKEAEKLEKA
ncbi:seryl-tRNA synthetase family protein [Histomonas meleagridis]|uniref:seryl-tRNA synthetase family protein n=1 Tax=Histomonas meleagridis TaxID=135588 RepID=UPI003559994A|nr:seryl-tRNA synthetase family protein [Histomonas meleagridis]KAH0799648.1 seryl-tRNA synthetase family protein [Histomonas meleagridis]